LVALAAGACGPNCGDKEEAEGVSIERPLLLATVPDYLQGEPQIEELGGTLVVQYAPQDDDGPSVFIQEFEAPQLGSLPERPPFERMDIEEGAANEVGFLAAWRCQELGLSTVVAWEIDPGESVTADVIEELAGLLEEACDDPASIPTAELDFAEVPPIPTCDPKEKDSVVVVHARNDTAEALTVQVWQGTDADVTEEETLAPGARGEWAVDVTDGDAGVSLSAASDPGSSAGATYLKGTTGPDQYIVVVGPPIRQRLDPDREIRVAGDCL
jgi:hypothetical protein